MCPECLVDLLAFLRAACFFQVSCYKIPLITDVVLKQRYSNLFLYVVRRAR